MKLRVIILALAIAAVVFGVWLYVAPPQAQAPVPPPVAGAVELIDPQPGMVWRPDNMVTGIAPGNWYFEASFPAKVYDSTGKLLTQAPAQAQDDWMTSDPVQFKAIFDLAQPATATGTLVLHNDNPSGDPSRDKEVRIPIRFIRRDWITDLGRPITLHEADSAAFKEVEAGDAPWVTVEAIHDSRCKPGVQCVWAGEISADLTLRNQSTYLKKPASVTLGTVNNKTAMFDEYQIALTAATADTVTLMVTKAAAATASGEVSGYVHVGPTCPVERIPPDPACADRPLVNGTVAVWKGASTSAVATTQTDAKGNFNVTVPAGDYRVTAGLTSMLPRCTETPVTVVAGQTAHIDISCDSGIR